ncbi:MAG: hypothetical protein HFG51_10780 [Lachnospiraceae bacterium]|nr:hypothetical protein [Lachnospiraceae bacterium]
MKKQKLLTILCAAALTLSASITSFAGTWAFDGPENWQWKYVNDDGTLAAPGWQFIDGKWYHMDSNSYLDIYWRTIDGKNYYFSEEEETLGQMVQNIGYLTGYYGDDGAWTVNEEPSDTWWRWMSGENWTEADTISWTAQFASYGISPSLFMPYSSGTTGQTFQLLYAVPADKEAAIYDIGNTLAMQLYMLSDGMASYNWVIKTDAAENTYIVFDYTYYG